LPNGKTLIFNYRPLKRVYEYPPGSGRFFAEFIDSLAGLYTMDMTTSAMRRIRTGGLSNPELSKDGLYIYYDSGGQVWRVPVSGDSLVPGADEVLTGFPHGAFHPSLAGDGVRLLFSTSGTAPQAGTYLLRLGDGTVQRLGQGPWFSPRWSADSDSLAFTDAAAIPYSLGFADSSGNTDGSRIANAREARWSPNGEWIAYVAIREGAPEPKLWVMRPDGSNARVLTTESVTDAFAWSPDSRRIAFVRYSGVDYSYTNGTTWTVDLATTDKVQVTFNPSP
jgi:Tol biopolymer transport system component